MHTITDAETAAALLSGVHLSLTDAARLILETLEESGGVGGCDPKARCRQVLHLGAEALRLSQQTVSFAEAVEETLRAKAHRAARTLRDIRYYMRRLMRGVSGLGERPVRAISPGECAAMLERVYPTPSQRRKARAILSGVFSTMRKRGFCGDNPVAGVDAPVVREQEILPLSLEKVNTLVETAKQEKHRACLPALGLMLFAGVRPEEVTRLTWGDIDQEEEEITIPARHSKTGGGRHIAICAPLGRLLAQPADAYTPETRICPRGWKRRWQQLRRAAGFAKWVPDTLRHTYASYYIKHYHDPGTLQLYMGHRDQSLLRTRYVNLCGISRQQAGAFWA